MEWAEVIAQEWIKKKNKYDIFPSMGSGQSQGLNIGVGSKFQAYYWIPQTLVKNQTNGIPLNCIWLWGFSPRALESVELPYCCYYSQVHSDPVVSISLIYGSYRSVKKLFVFDKISLNHVIVFNRNTWNYITIYKLFVFRIVTRNYNCLQIITIISFLRGKPKKQFDIGIE